MLKYFAFKNFGCFTLDESDETGEGFHVFTMEATRERIHGERLPRVGRQRLLPVSAIYGANASGKSTLIDALEVLRSILVETRNPKEPLPVKPHELYGRQSPTEFEISFVVPRPSAYEAERGHDEWNLVYRLAADRSCVHRESLTRVRTRDEVYLFERDGNRVELFDDLAESKKAVALSEIIGEKEVFLSSLARVVGDTAPAGAIIRSAFDWFAKQLTIVRPQSLYMPLPYRLSKDDVFRDAINEHLSTADTGISELRTERTFAIDPKEILAPLSESALDEVRNGNRTILVHEPAAGVLVSADSAGELVIETVVAVHDQGAVGKFSLPLSRESDGTIRFVHLLPILLEFLAKDSNAVFVIDELENSLHPNLTGSIVARLLDSCTADSRVQLIFTTHEVQLMAADLLRRDEIWLVTKGKTGQSSLARVSDYAGQGVREGADLLKIYTSGRIDGVPREV